VSTATFVQGSFLTKATCNLPQDEGYNHDYDDYRHFYHHLSLGI